MIFPDTQADWIKWRTDEPGAPQLRHAPIAPGKGWVQDGVDDQGMPIWKRADDDFDQFDEYYHGPKPPGPGWTYAGEGPRGGKRWKPGPHAKVGPHEAEPKTKQEPSAADKKLQAEHQAALQTLLKDIGKPDGGFTYQPISHTSPVKGYAVSPYPQRSFAIKASDITADDVTEYAIRNVDALSQPGNFMGGWHDPKTDMVYLDTIIVAEDHETAKKLCIDHDQIAYFDLEKHEVVTVNQEATSGGATTKTETLAIKIKPTKERAFEGKPVTLKTNVSKQQAGKIGEAVAIAWLKEHGTKAWPLNFDRNNFPIDIVTPDSTVEVKTGNVANSVRAQQWRLTIGEPGPKEKAKLANMSDEEKAAWNSEKQRKIHERKQKALDDLERIAGKKIKSRTITALLNPDKSIVDLYSFDGIHDRIGWNSDEAKKAYVGSVTYETPDKFAESDDDDVEAVSEPSTNVHIPKEVLDEVVAELDAEAKSWMKAVEGNFANKSHTSFSEGDGKLVPLPDIRQPDDYSCGLCITQACAELYGIKKSHAEWKNILGTSKAASTDPQAIIKALTDEGLEVTAKQNMTLDDLRAAWQQGKPVICCIKEYATPGKETSEKYGHYVAVVGLGLGMVMVQDPSLDNILSGEDADQAGGIMPIREDKWDAVWHDKICGVPYDHFGIVVGPPVTSHFEQFDDAGDIYHGPKAPGPGWVQVGVGPRGGKTWKLKGGSAAKDETHGTGKNQPQSGDAGPRQHQGDVQTAKRQGHDAGRGSQGKDETGGGKEGQETKREVTTPANEAWSSDRLQTIAIAPSPTGKIYVPDPTNDPNGDGVPDASRVGVPAAWVPPPPKDLPRLPNLTLYERKVENSFASAFEKDPDGMVKEYMRQLTAGEIGDAPNIFSTDDAKMLDTDYNPPGTDEKNLSDDVKNARSTLNTMLHQTANAIAKRAFLMKLDELKTMPPDKKTVLVTGGGCGAGKTFALDNIAAANSIAKSVGAVWDAAGEQNSDENPWILEECQKRGIKATFMFVNADPLQRWGSPQGGVVQRAGKKGRMVDARLFADSYAIGTKSFKAFQDKHQTDAEFVIIDNAHGKPTLVDTIPQDALSIDADNLYAKASEFIDKSTAITPAVRRGASLGRRIWPPPPSEETHEQKAGATTVTKNSH